MFVLLAAFLFLCLTYLSRCLLHFSCLSSYLSLSVSPFPPRITSPCHSPLPSQLIARLPFRCFYSASCLYSALSVSLALIRLSPSLSSLSVGFRYSLASELALSRSLGLPLLLLPLSLIVFPSPSLHLRARLHTCSQSSDQVPASGRPPLPSRALPRGRRCFDDSDPCALVARFVGIDHAVDARSFPDASAGCC